MCRDCLVILRLEEKALPMNGTQCGEESHVFSSAAVGDNGMMYFTCNTGTARRRRRAQLGEGDTPGVGEFYAINPALHMPKV